MLKSRTLVCLCWSGCYTSCTRQRNPTTARRERFNLLPFGPGPFRISLSNLALQDSSSKSMLTPSLVRTPIQRVTMHSRTPVLKPSSKSGLPVAWITGPATDPSHQKRSILGFMNVSPDFPSNWPFSGCLFCKKLMSCSVWPRNGLRIQD